MPSQDTRVARITVPAIADPETIGLVRYDITEGISELFEWRVEIVAEKSLPVDKLLSEPCAIKHKSYTTERDFHARIIDVQNAGIRGNYRIYNLVMRPWLWLLSRTTNCQIFENKNVREIIETVFKAAGFSSGRDFVFRLQRNYEKREYTVQYRETDLAFVQRLMEEEGIFYYFEHKESSHVCVMGDSKSSHEKISDFETVDLVSIVGADVLDREHLFDWHSERRTRTGEVELNDYDFKSPDKSLKVNQKAAAGKYQFYDHPANYKTQGLGRDRAQVRLEAEQAHGARRYANGDAVPLFPGALINVDKNDEDGENGEYILIRSSHSYITESYESTNQPDTANDAYDGTYEFQKSDQPYRAPPVTPRPLVYGTHTGKVCGPPGEEIHVDEDGRILVEFFWDRNRGYGGQKTHSRWTRVAQLWAGPGWGAQFIPRIGMEVVVTYEEGDPDHPIVMGCVYNGKNNYPYPMPGQKTKSGLKSNSSLGGNGYNEFMFEDKKGREQIVMHAEKDHDVEILHKETTLIGERFMPSKGDASREHTIKMGDDKLTINMGDQNVTIQMGDQNTKMTLGSQTNFAMQRIEHTSMMSNTTTVIASSIAMSPASIALTSPMISLTAAGAISITASVINITGVVNLTGALNVTGPVLINGMVPVTIPA